MSIRAVLIGLLGVAFVTSYTYFNDSIMRQTMFIGNNMPISIYGALVLFMILLYPLLRKFGRRFCLTRAEIATILVIMLPACAIPGANLLRLFTPSLIMPHRFEKTEPGWEKQNVMEMVPDGMLAEVTPQNEDTVLNGFIRGLGEGNKSVAFSEIPWKAWLPSMKFWLPIILSLWLGLLGLSLVVHKQWVDHEHLPYPLVTFTKSLLPNEDGSESPVFKDRSFWVAMFIVFGIYVYNYLNVWFPSYLMGAIPSGVDFSSLGELFPAFKQGGGVGFLSGYYSIFFTVIAIAFFLPTDVSFSMGIGPFIWITLTGMLSMYGVANSGWQGQWPFGINRENMFNMGAYFAMLLVLLYTGRYYYLAVFRKSFGMGGKEKIAPTSIWGARLFVLSLILFTFYSTYYAGLPWSIAVLFGLCTMAVYLVMGRMIAETGVFFIVTAGTPATIILAVLGPKALGPAAILTMFMFCLILFYDPREALMPFVVNALKLADDTKVKVGRSAAMIVLALVVGLGVGIPVTLYFQYNRGIDLSAWQNQQSQNPFNETIANMQRLEAQGQLQDAGTATGLARYTGAQPHKQGMIVFGVAAGCVLLFSALRLRFTKWPFHPVMFLVWSTYSGKCFAQSFLIGWLIKMAVTKYGGAGFYQKLKPLMFGLIAGEMLGGVLPMIISAIYYLITGDQPKPFIIMPS
ncbi:MAG: hypothetical protein EOL87_01040 [Spartobacteria bacterium]|nr:hypothetical protein [Spartobacteria bacterium]